MAAGIAGIIYSIKRRPNDTEYEDGVMAQIQNIKPCALRKLGIEENQVNEIPPIKLNGYDRSLGTMIKKGKDGKYRSNKYKYAILFFGDNEMYVYTYIFSTTENNGSESTGVYHYKDIVSISTQSNTFTFRSESISYGQVIEISTTGADRISIPLHASYNPDRDINAIRQLLKTKK